MGIKVGIQKIDERGRVTIPKEHRESLGLHPGDRVRVESGSGEIRIRRVIPVDEFIEKFEGCITEDNAIGKTLDPLRIKEIWHLAGD